MSFSDARRPRTVLIVDDSELMRAILTDIVNSTDGFEVIAEAGTNPAVLVAEVDPARVEYTRRNWPFLRDRRIDAYGPILNRWLA